MTPGFFSATCNHISSIFIVRANSSAPRNIAKPRPIPRLSTVTVRSDRYPESCGGSSVENFLRVYAANDTPTVATTSSPNVPIR